ncbi:putative aminoacyl-tRNA hydrolase [Helianthus annuus]|nr:putative aminoacyl-tRNA hydrolase [Helianthus annuus]
MLRKLVNPNRGFCTSVQSQRPWLFIGLGNPGDKFKGTRHNVGFNMIDAFAESQGIAMDTVFCIVDGIPVLLAKPQTYMNLSGESSGPLAAYYKLPLNRVVVFHDDMDLPCGVLRLQPRGGHGSHNGMKSVIYHFRGNREFTRLRIGIGKPPGQMDPKAFLLQKFNATAQERGVIALKELVAKGVEESGRRFNTEQKYKHIKVADNDDMRLGQSD